MRHGQPTDLFASFGSHLFQLGIPLSLLDIVRTATRARLRLKLLHFLDFFGEADVGFVGRIFLGGLFCSFCQTTVLFSAGQAGRNVL